MLRQIRSIICSMIGGHRYVTQSHIESEITPDRYLHTRQRCWVCGVEMIAWSQKQVAREFQVSMLGNLPLSIYPKAWPYHIDGTDIIRVREMIE